MNSLTDGAAERRSANFPGFLREGGTVATLLQALDWSRSPLSPPDQWSASLQTLMATILPAKAQIVLFWGPEYIALYNDAYAPTIGAKHPKALGRPAQENWSELWDDLEPLLRGVRETGETFSAQDRPFYIERRGLGETAWFDVSYSAVREVDGSVGGILCIVTETTERVQFERRQAFLLELGRTLPALGDAAQIEAQAVSRLGQYLGASRVFFAQDKGDTRHFVVEQQWLDGAPSMAGQHQYAHFAEHLHQRLGNGERIVGDFAAGEQADLCASLLLPVTGSSGLEATLAVHFHTPHAFLEDECLLIEETAKLAWSAITHARAEAKLIALNASLEQRVASMLAQREASLVQLHEARKMEMIGQLTGGIAHDFNNMLTPIIASMELVQRRLPDDRSQRLVNSALQAADRARTLVGRLLTFARRQTLKPQVVGLAGLIDDMRELIARSLGPTIDIHIAVDADLPGVVVDPGQLELALLNLVVNARDAMPEGGRVQIRAGVADETTVRPAGIVAGQVIWLQVADNGCGMDESVLARCFEPFYSTKAVGQGTGLGLPMVQGLAVQSGGGFTVRSRLRLGTEATLWLPASRAPSLPRESDMPLSQAPLYSAHVLLVDDEDIVRQATALQLRDLGYQVTEAQSAAQALQLIDQGLALDVLVTDHVMAETTGAELAHQLRQRMADLPILIITGYANLSPTELHGFEVLRKPFRRAELAHSLARLQEVKMG
ncbi:ATP-binding protein [Pseudomonas cremoricolorata]|uniref:histidine kinase n=1 Tax=Pseudomonas cremoricolorata TaxID=157783 RepID=A0A089WRH6_9PSED|nr:ATP-binding protein [Pseudomonas cremoricolorata]AIR91181.1 histidine kinase [Pseudomonas cremoricolorata]